MPARSGLGRHRGGAPKGLSNCLSSSCRWLGPRFANIEHTLTCSVGGGIGIAQPGPLRVGGRTSTRRRWPAVPDGPDHARQVKAGNSLRRCMLMRTGKQIFLTRIQRPSGERADVDPQDLLRICRLHRPARASSLGRDQTPALVPILLRHLHAIKILSQDVSTQGPRGCSYAEINEWLMDRCIEDAKKRPHPTIEGKTVWQVFEEERPFLMAYRGPFDGFHATEVAVSKTCLTTASPPVPSGGRSTCGPTPIGSSSARTARPSPSIPGASGAARSPTIRGTTCRS